MYNTPETKACLSTLIGWKDHYNLTDIPALGATLNTSDSGQYFQQFHPALRLDLIEATLPEDRDLPDYLTEKVEDSIAWLMNTLVREKGHEKYAKKVLANDVILDRYGWANDKITNESRFVGFRFKVNTEIGLRMVIKSIGFQFTLPQTDLTIYLYHSSKANPVTTFTVSTTNGIEWSWEDVDIDLYADGEDIVGGEWVIGYYQDDIAGEAINYTGFDWVNGPCGTCRGGASKIRKDFWRSLTRFVDMTPMYVPSASYVVGEMFDLRDAFNDYNNSYGMNFRMSAECDLSYWYCQHKDQFVEPLGLTVAWMILRDMKFSMETNYIEESMKALIIRDLEGDKQTNGVNIVDKLDESVQKVKFVNSKQSAHCLPCQNSKGVKYKTA